MSEQTELRERLSRLAEDTAPPARAGLADVIVVRHRRRRRERLGFASVAAAVAAVVVGATVVIDDRTAVDPAPLAVPASESAVDENAPSLDGAGLPPADVYHVATRGSLADDSAFVAAVQHLPWTDATVAGAGVPDAPEPSRHVVFAGDVGAARVALVAGLGARGDTAVAWFVGAAGAPAENMQLAGVPHGVDPSLPTGRFDPATGALVVVGAPGDRLDVSLRPDVAADASVTRSWRPATTDDGLAAVDLRPDDVTSGSALRYRVVRDGSAPYVAVPETAATDVIVYGADPAAVRPTWLRPQPPAAATDAVLTTAIGEVLGWSGLPPEEITFTVLWSGAVPAPTDSAARVTLLAATLPSGAVYLSAPLAVTVAGSGIGGSTCGTALLPAGTPLAELSVALRCIATDLSVDSPQVPSVVVVGPPTATDARFLDDAGEVVLERRMRNGVAVGEFAEGVTSVETRAADGTVLARLTPLDHADLGD
jgi:hypothetical protein